jgi:hypothetical protein
LCKVSTTENRIMDAEGVLWYNLQRPQTIGLPAAISKLLAVMAP